MRATSLTPSRFRLLELKDDLLGLALVEQLEGGEGIVEREAVTDHPLDRQLSFHDERGDLRVLPDGEIPAADDRGQLPQKLVAGVDSGLPALTHERHSPPFGDRVEGPVLCFRIA